MLCCMDAPIKTIQRNTYFTTYFNLHLNWWQLIQYSDDSAIVVLYLKAMTVNDNNCFTPTVECSQYIIRLLRLIRMIMKRNQGKGYDEVDHRNLHKVAAIISSKRISCFLPFLIFEIDYSDGYLIYL